MGNLKQFVPYILKAELHQRSILIHESIIVFCVSSRQAAPAKVFCMHHITSQLKACYIRLILIITHSVRFVKSHHAKTTSENISMTSITYAGSPIRKYRFKRPCSIAVSVSLRCKLSSLNVAMKG